MTTGLHQGVCYHCHPHTWHCQYCRRCPLSPSCSRSPTFFTLQLGNRQDTVSIHCLKPVPSDVHSPSALPRPRGRPPSFLRTPSSPSRPPLHVHFADSSSTQTTSPAASHTPSPASRPHRLPLTLLLQPAGLTGHIAFLSAIASSLRHRGWGGPCRGSATWQHRFLV